MIIIGYFVGKSCFDKYVTVRPRHGKYELLFIFEDNEEAMKYYDRFNYKREKLPVKHKIKILLCKHENEYKLDTGSKIFHYLHCPNCKRAIYVNHESEEDRVKRTKEMWKEVRRNEIIELEKSIISSKSKLIQLKEEFKLQYNEEL